MANILQNFDVIRGVWVAAATNQVSMNRIYFLVNTVAGNPTDQDATAALDTATATTFPGILSSAATYHGMYGQLVRPRIAPATGYQLFAQVVSTVNAGPGTRGATLLPTQVRGIWRWTVALAARGLNCRFYAPFPSTSDNTTGIGPVALYQGALASLATALLGPLPIGSGGNTAVLNPVDFDTTHGVKNFFRGYSVHGRWATQRRSGPYGRPNVAPF